jgi:hypothetical protein
MSLEDEVDQNTAKGIAAAAEANGGSQPAEPAGTPGLTRPAGSAGPGSTAPRPAASPPGVQTPGRGPGSVAPPSAQPAPSPSGPTPAKQPSTARATVIDTEDHADGIRLMPGADN